LKPYLAAFSKHESLPTDSTSSSLQDVVQKLSEASHNGTHIWTPAKLKSMSSWQQQDAQEYYSKIVDDLEKEASKVFGAAAVKHGLESSEKKKGDIQEQMAAPPHSVPLEGLLAQRVACTRCGFSEGLSMIPFNCLTVPLGSGYEYDLADCLNEYTHIEDIPEVECAKCTLLKAKTELSRMLPQPESETESADTDGKKTMQLPPALREKIAERLKAVTEALANDDFSDKTLKEVCQISKKAHTSSTKTRQAVIGRAPRSLVVHINRSVFDEMTGAQRKNYAAVRYPQVLDLGKWMLGSKVSADGLEDPKSLAELAITEASESMLSSRTQRDPCLYRLKAVVTHYGRHENGHYIAYRQHPRAVRATDKPAEDAEDSKSEETPNGDSGKLPWWRLSDEDVSTVSDEDVLQQGGVFMLFYEREEQPVGVPAVAPICDTAEAQVPDAVDTESSSKQEDELETSTSIVEQKSDTILPEAAEENTEPTPASEASVSTTASTTNSTTEEEESETDTEDHQPVQDTTPVPKPTTQPPMRTARLNSQSDSGFPSPHRVVAAT
jgi:ubiquitin carboxyl-terminal hydrolase 1